MAYLPEENVIEGFEFLKSSRSQFETMFAYIEKIYIGLLKENSKTTRKVPLYPINTWNLYTRVLKKLPKTNNSVEAWHGQLGANNKKHLTINNLTEILRKEQTNTENNLAKLNMGEIKKRSSKAVKRDMNLYNVVMSFDPLNISTYLSNIALNFE